MARAGIGRPIDWEKRRYWQAQVEAWRGSGLSQVEYCRRQGLSPAAFTTWKHRLGAAGESADAEVDFVTFPVVAVEEPSAVPGGAPAAAALTVVVDDRYRVEVGDGFSAATLARVVQTLRAL